MRGQPGAGGRERSRVGCRAIQPPTLTHCPLPLLPVQVRPVVYEEIRQEADDDMRRLIKSIKVSGAAVCTEIQYRQ